ncbi:ABC transporter permease [Nibricoccus sp. IMCC34717]|uniref:ABC transporter permease n=1 Tax=Nibricoccus sp. IMCC34717 TaxID=3034021 RepID=UPI00385032D8
MASKPRPTDLSRRVPGLAGWAMIAPLILWMVAFIVVPGAVLLVYSFCTRDEIGRVVYSFTLENYSNAFDPVYLNIFGRSLLYAAVTTVLCVIIGYPMAYTMARSSPAWRHRLLMLVMIPFWTSFLIRTYAWITILKREGMLNGLLEYFNLITAPFDFLYTPVAVIVGLVYSYLPFMILPVYSSAEKLDESLVEAAHDLGAGPLRVFWEVIIPLTRPGVIAGTLMVFVPAIGMFAITDLLGGARVPMVGNIIQNQFFQARNWPFGAALGMVFMGMFVFIYWLLQRRQASLKT